MDLITIGAFFAITITGQVSPSNDQDLTSETQTAAKAETPPAASAPAERRAPSADDMGMWLVNLARHQGHLVGRSDPRMASLHVIALLEGAQQVAPDCAEADYWLFDLLLRMGRVDAAREALAQYVKLAPDDEAARIRLLEMELDRRQTAEERSNYIKSELALDKLPRTYESELHRRMAEFFYERRETKDASREVEQALRFDSMNVPARRLAYEIFGETEPALQRVEMALQLIAINPSQANLVWDLGEFLDRISLHRQAQEWYNRAIDLHHRAEGKPVPAEFWYKLALSYSRSEDYAEARDAASSALKIDGSMHLARLLRSAALEKMGDRDAADADMDFVAKVYQEQYDDVIRKKTYNEAAEISWFYCYYRPEKERALTLAKVAMEESNPSSLARLAYGYALRMNGQTDEALKVLEPLAATDQLAALELARIHIERGDKGKAISILHKASTLQYSGIGYSLIRDLLAKYDETCAEAPLNSKVLTVLEKFHRDVFDYYQRPGDFAKVSMRFVSESLPTAGPVNVVFRLENIGTFPITFGEGYMARSLLALSAKVTGDGGAEYRNYLQVMMNSRPVLLPGDAVEKTVAIDVGPLREHLIRTVSRPMEIELTALFDPIYENNELSVGPGTIKCGPLKAVREGVDTSPAAMAALLDRAGSADVAQRTQAADTIAALLAEAEKAAPDSKVAALPREAMITALAGLLADSDWRVRARALVGAGWSKLEDRTTNAAAQAVRDKDSPVVKMLAVRLFAQQHGEKFRPVLEQLSKTDPSRCVRIMARSYLPEPAGAQANRVESRAEESMP
jgi:tetratricopeptide (TPR) repeat protein